MDPDRQGNGAGRAAQLCVNVVRRLLSQPLSPALQKDVSEADRSPAHRSTRRVACRAALLCGSAVGSCSVLGQVAGGSCTSSR